MAIEKIRKNGPGSRIIGYKVRLPAHPGSRHQWTTTNFMCCDYEKTELDAEEEAERHHVREKDIRRREKKGLEPDREALKDFTVGQMVTGYLSDRYSPEGYWHKRDEYSEADRELLDNSDIPTNFKGLLWDFQTRYENMTLLDFTQDVANQYVEDRLKKKWKPPGSYKEPALIHPNTVKREIASLNNVWVWAKKIRQLRNMSNPWTGMKVPGATRNPRQRGLNNGELERLMVACRECSYPNRFYVPLAINVALHTAMRLQEVVNLTWNDIDFVHKRINIRKSKTDKRTGRKGRKIVLPPIVENALSTLKRATDNGGVITEKDLSTFKPVRIEGLWGDRIFPRSWMSTIPVYTLQMEREMSVGTALSDAFDRAVVRANIHLTYPTKILTFKDLRAAATMIFHRARLSDREIQVMKNGSSDSYDVVELHLEAIQEKLDNYYYGQPRDEFERDVKVESLSMIIDGMKAGLSKEDAIKRVAEAEIAYLRELAPKAG